MTPKDSGVLPDIAPLGDSPIDAVLVDTLPQTVFEFYCVEEDSFIDTLQAENISEETVIAQDSNCLQKVLQFAH